MSVGISRRAALKHTLALAFTVAGAEALLSPREARAHGADFRVLSAQEIRALESFGEALLPGAREAGIAHFVDQQLSVAAPDSLLMIRYLDIPPPYVGFYRPALAALDAASKAAYQRPFDELAPEVADEFVGVLSRKIPNGWQGPPSPLFFFIARSDAVDVVYGTPEGFKKLGIPYMPHIMPARKW